jgi:nucleoside 2-deoxyribosyltransferase
MKCFIAMAFDRGDTDKVYDKGILPVLKELGIEPIRVDRVEHNGDIDDTIISGIVNCDFMIADLTYARPSVYFEAGYAQRVVPVIYTTRSDHFRGKSDDTRVHFDLLMRNMIGWKDADNVFKKRLKKRIKHVIKPMLRVRQADEAKAACELAFAQLSHRQKAEEALRVGAAAISRLGYKKYRDRDDRWLPLLHHGHYSMAPTAFWKVQNEQLETVALYVDPQFSIPNVKDLWSASAFSRWNLNVGGNRPKAVTERYVVCTFGRISDTAISRRLNSCAHNAQCEEFRWESTLIVPPKKFFESGVRIYNYSRSHGISVETEDGTDRLTVRDDKLVRSEYGSPDKVVGQITIIPRVVAFHFIDSIKEMEELKTRIKNAVGSQNTVAPA